MRWQKLQDDLAQESVVRQHVVQSYNDHINEVHIQFKRDIEELQQKVNDVAKSCRSR